MSLATATIFLDKRKTEIGYGIVKIRITHKRVQRDYSTKIKLKESVYSKLNVHNNLLDKRVKDPEVIELFNLLYCVKDEIHFFEDGFLTRANNLIKKLGSNFTFLDFKELFDNYDKIESSKSEEHNFIIMLQKKAEDLYNKGQFSHSNSFIYAAKSLERFNESINLREPLQIKDLTPDYLEKWCKYMRRYGKVSQKLIDGVPKSVGPASDTTISFYSKAMKIVYLEALERGIVPYNSNPFGSKRFNIPESANKKKALTDEQLNLLKNYKPESMSLQEASLDLWFFSYYANGMNFTDILNLRKTDIKGDSFTFIRQKTKRKPVLITVRINEKINEIIKKQEALGTTTYLFPYLEGIEDLARKKSIIQQVIKLTNKHMNIIAKTLGIEEKINTYEARHTFATKLMRSDAPLKMIQEKLGHKKISTTEQYLGSFTQEEEDKFLDLL
jgi:integrase